ncbi:hypothetical protein TTRE_0000553401 [Trichuris trichiura]|uniref:DUF4440 domain-containing protein n=1 Tax=Trichuris trichiura TaxID=36087 RepID=A0A077ZCJ0_TRITR|nr:hypothetical protein TTRE_0000553401 [Trichuris trichiura]
MAGLINKELRAKVEKRLDEYNKLLNAHDWARLGDFFYPKNAKLMLPGGICIDSSEEIVKHLEKDSEKDKSEVILKIDEVLGDGEWAFTRGTYKRKAGDNVQDNGK